MRPRHCTGSASLQKFIRTPADVFSNDSIAPKFSCTTMPALRKPAATSAATSSSSAARMRGPVSKSSIREPNALKIEATCAPVAPPPMTNIERGTSVKEKALLWVLVNSMPGTGKMTANTANADDDLVSPKMKPGLV